MAAVTIDLPPKTERRLRDEARQRDLSGEEFAALILAAYLHDLGMVAGRIRPAGAGAGVGKGAYSPGSRLAALVEEFRAGVEASGVGPEELEAEIAAAGEEARRDRIAKREAERERQSSGASGR